MENDLLTMTSGQIMEVNQNLAHIQNTSSLTWSRDVSHERDHFFPKNLKIIDKLVAGLKKEIKP